jgi:outer membrane protein TolC
MKSMILALLVATISFNSYAQVKTEKDMKQEIKKMEELIQEYLGMVKTYPEKPAYYLQVNKTGCRLLVRVNDIPVGYHFVEDEGESMLYPINDLLLGSGKHTVSIQVYPRTGETEVTNIKAKRSELNTKQQQDLQRFELIQAYFNVQLQKQLLASSQYNWHAMQKHYDNALKLEQQGFISKGQRMQFEVAKNNAQRSEQASQANLKASLFQLNNLLQSSQITELTTPLFINSTQNQDLNTLLKSYADQSALVQKLQMDTQLAQANVTAQNAAKKPHIFAFGEYSLDDKNNWIVGLAAQYNLFSGIDKNKNVQAAELQRYASELMTARTKQEIENVIYKSYSEATTAQQSDQLLQQNIKAAQENLRIQELSFKEDMGTATQVIDAQNMLSALKAETALNAYKYVMSLATLLQSHGSIHQFQTYLLQPNTRFIR